MSEASQRPGRRADPRDAATDRRRVPAWLAALVLLCAPGAGHAAERALLIGINDYIEVPDLHGAVNDVEMMREILVTRFAFRPEDIEVLTDQQATRAAILAALDGLASRAHEGDLVYIHFSGHGSQTQDRNGDEDDGMDETIVPQDGRSNGIPDITDDEISEKLHAIQAKTVVVVLDSCHAGTATRSLGALSDSTALMGGLRPRYVPPDTRTELYEDLGVQSRSVVPLVSSGHVLLTGAAHDEEALDGPVDRTAHGLFSYALGMSLSRSAPTASAREVFDGVQQEFERIRAQLNLRRMPDPQLEAKAEDLDHPLLAAAAPTAPAASGGGAGEPARLAYLGVEPLGPGRVRLARGSSLGAGLGSLWAVYPPEERRFEPGAALALAEVTSLEGGDAVAKLTPGDVAVPSGARAVALAPPPAADDIPVALVDVDAKRAAALRKALSERLPAVHFVGPGEFARFVVRCEAKRCLVTGADGLFELSDLPASDAASLVGPLASLFARSLTVSELLSLDNPSASMDLKVDVVARGPSELEPGDERGMVLVSSADSPRFRVRHEGDPRTRENSLQLRIRSSVDCTLTVVDIDAQGGVQVLFPNAISESKGYHPGGALAAGEEFLLPDSLAAGNRAGFHVDYAPPAGLDTVRAFCTRDPRAAKALRDSVRSLDPNAPGTRSVKQHVGTLRQQLAELAARGLKIVEDVPVPVEEAPAPAVVAEAWSADWTAASVTVEVRE